jgi:proteasome lid subunit RPN8/RPN11
MSIELSREALQQIEEHGREDYPNECCGVLLGKDQDGRKIITGILRIKNSRPANENLTAERPEIMDLLKQAYKLLQLSQDKSDSMRDWLQRADPIINSARNRFLIDPADFVASEREARKQGVDILGFYHSHPDHPARPSEFDREHAWPWYTYLILRVEKGLPQETTGWLLTEDHARFLPEEIAVIGAAAPVSSGAGETTRTIKEPL